MFIKKDGGINTVTKKRSAIGVFFSNPIKEQSNHLLIDAVFDMFLT